MTKITAADRENLIEFLEMSKQGEDDEEGLRGNAELQRLLENGEAPLPSDAASLIPPGRLTRSATAREPGFLPTGSRSNSTFSPRDNPR